MFTKIIAVPLFPVLVFAFALLIDVAIGGAVISGWEAVLSLVAISLLYWAFFTGRLVSLFRKV